jgi:hypothetical protein
VAHWEGDRHGAKEVIVDPEFGAFGDNGCIDFIKTDFDRDLDKASLLPGLHFFSATTLAGFDLTTHNSAGADDTTRPRRDCIHFFQCKKC